MNKLNCDLAMPACSLRHMHDKINEIIDNMGSGGGGSAPFNLLDNSDFSNPINQRAQSSYTGAVYGLDRWRSWENGNTVTVGDGCITLSGTVHFLQYVPPELLREGKTYTFGVTKKDGSVMTVSGTYPMSSDAIEGGVSLQLDNDAPSVSILWAGDYINAGLYEGEYTAANFPQYTPKGYGVELVECMRYYQIVPYTKDVVLTEPNGGVNFGYRFLVAMRIAPTVTNTSAKWWETGKTADSSGTGGFEVSMCTDRAFFGYFVTGLASKQIALQVSYTISADL